MALGERFRSGGARGIARFLADHQRCDAGFDVRRDEVGSGRLRITCLGCGDAVDYRAAEAGELAAGLPVAAAENGEGERSDPVLAPPPGPAAEPRPAAARPEIRPERPAPPGRRRIPGWVSAAVIGALIIGGLTMVAIGVLTDDGEQATTPSQPETTPDQEVPQDTAGQATEGAGSSEQGQAQQGETAQPGAAPTRPQGTGSSGASSGGQAVALERRRFADRFTIGVPPAWERGVAGGAVVITAPGATAELNVFFESGGRPHRQLARAASGFLAQRHQAGEVEKSKPVRVGGRRGLQVRIGYPGGEEVAVVLAAKGFSYLVLRRIDRGASPDIGQQAESALASFRPG